MKQTAPKPDEEIRSEWDAIASLRNEQIESGTDISYNLVLKPLVIRLLESTDLVRALDIGCGTGQLTAALAQRSGHVTAIDISESSVILARENVIDLNNVTILNESLRDFARSSKTRFTTLIANMSLSAMPLLSAAVADMVTLLVPGGHIVVTIPHPCFWPKYWGYDSADWFNYWSELSIEANFRISLEQTDMRTTHLHRPLSAYLNAFSDCGLTLEKLEEPAPAKMPAPASAMSYPRFLGWRCRLQGK